MSKPRHVWALIGGVALLLAAGSATIVEVAFALSLNINLAIVLAAAGIALALLADVLYGWKSSGQLSYILHAGVGTCAGLQGHIARRFKKARAITHRVYASYMYLRRYVIRHMVDLLASYIVRHHPTLVVAIRKDDQRAVQPRKQLRADSCGDSGSIQNDVVKNVLNTLVEIDDKLGRMEVALEQAELLLTDLLEIARYHYGKDVPGDIPGADALLHKTPPEKHMHLDD